ncbi:MAG: hypothetical protein AAFP22_05055 [Planctomycetota bacterium]
MVRGVARLVVLVEHACFERHALRDVVRAAQAGELEPAVAGRPGLFRGTLLPSRPGRYGATIEPGPGGPESPVRAEFSVVLPSRESADPSPDPGALERLARETGGVFATVTSLDALEDAFPEGQERREPVSAKLEDAWDRWLTLLLALGLLGAEWIVRKWAELV